MRYKATDHLIKGSLRPLLEASISTKLLSQLESFLKSRQKEDQVQNLWLLSSAVRDSFRDGSLNIKRSPFHYPVVDFDDDEGNYSNKARVFFPLFSFLFFSASKTLFGIFFFSSIVVSFGTSSFTAMPSYLL